MRRMMTTYETAAALGVTERCVYAAIKRTGLRWHLQRQGGAYMFTPEDVVWLADVLKTRNRGYLRRTLTPETCADERTHAT